MATTKQINSFRHFNRFYTDYLGLLGTSLYDSPVNLTEARILYELDSRPGSHARELMERLTLDKGYLSRLLKRFTKQGWVQEAPSDKDARVKELRLSKSGTELMQELHDKAIVQAEEALGHLSANDRKQLLSAMATIENILS